MRDLGFDDGDHFDAQVFAVKQRFEGRNGAGVAAVAERANGRDANRKAVSYTHLDVYKRQAAEYAERGSLGSAVSCDSAAVLWLT